MALYIDHEDIAPSQASERRTGVDEPVDRRRALYCPPMRGALLDASTVPVADRYWIDTR
jgi:hypothetical protein